MPAGDYPRHVPQYSWVCLPSNAIILYHCLFPFSTKQSNTTHAPPLARHVISSWVESFPYTGLHGFRTRNSKQRPLSVAFGSALSALGVDHLVWCVLSTILRSFRTCHFIKRVVVAALGFALSALNVDHPVRCVLCPVLCPSCADHSEKRPIAAVPGSALYVLDIDHPVQGVLCAAVHNFLALNYKRRDFATYLRCWTSSTFCP